MSAPARHAYEGVCPDPRFAQLFGAARHPADARHLITCVDGQIDWRERELPTCKKLSDQRRAEIVAEVRSLQWERERSLDDRAETGAELERTRQRLGV